MTVELTVVCVLIILVIAVAASTSLLLKNKLKHNFLELTGKDSVGPTDIPDIFNYNLKSGLNEISKSVSFYKSQSWPALLDHLQSEGWTENKSNPGFTHQIRNFKRGTETLHVIETKEGKIGLRI